MNNINTWTGLPVEESIRIKKTEINGESTSMVQPTLGLLSAKQNRMVGVNGGSDKVDEKSKST